jgi:hypothetical protein
MANINITSDAWTEISITSGTVQNISATADIELSAEQTDNSGVVLKPSELYQWDNETIYARAVTEETGALRVVNFKKATGGGGSYVLPVATASKLGGVKVGSNLNIDESGVLSATGGGAVNYSTTEQQIGTWIDGKPIYQIIFECITPSTANTSTTIQDITALDLKGCIDLSGYIDLNGWYTPINFSNTIVSPQICFVTWCIDTEIRMNVTAHAINKPCYITLRYTKTTD